MQPMGDPIESVPCDRCGADGILIVKNDVLRATGPRQYPYYSPTCGKTFHTSSDHRKFLRNPTDFRGNPLSLPDGTPLRYHEDG